MGINYGLDNLLIAFIPKAQNTTINGRFSGSPSFNPFPSHPAQCEQWFVRAFIWLTAAGTAQDFHLIPLIEKDLVNNQPFPLPLIICKGIKIEQVKKGRMDFY